MKLFALILIILTSLSAQPADQSYPVSAKNPRYYRDYPGGRGEHQLIVYTSVYGEKTTGTNQWGIEAIVKNDIVISVGGNNSPIQDEEYVISGHGRARLFIANNIRIGSKISMSDSSVSVSFDAESFMIYIKIRQNELRNKQINLESGFTQEYRTVLKRIIDSLYVSIGRILEGQNEKIDSTRYLQVLNHLNEIEYRISLTTAAEGRGVWHRPKEKNNKEIGAIVKKIADAGFNMIFLETIWTGETIYPGFVTRQKAEFSGFDPLRVYIQEGKKYGVDIHAWIHTFFVGYVRDDNDPRVGPILTSHPEWQFIMRNGKKISRSEPGFLFVNPANPDAQNYIASLYKEVSSMYPELAGIQMDYIRYPVDIPLEESSDYSDLSRVEFKKISGYDPMEIDPVEHPVQWEQWRLWRENIITGFVKRIRWENPEILLSAEIFSDIDDARKTKMQNWGEWANKGFVNFLIPKAYFVNVEPVSEAIAKMRLVVGDQFPLYAGLAPFLKITPSILLQQIEKCRQMKVQGVIFFASSSFDDEQLRLLSIGPFREKARTPQVVKKK